MPEQITTALALTLYTVTLPWHPRQPEIGTYGTSVWAADTDDAVMQVALEMADYECGQDATEEVKRSWAEGLVENAGSAQTIVMRIIDTVEEDLRTLIGGPSGEFGPEEQAKFDQVMDLLGIPRPQAPAERPRG